MTNGGEREAPAGLTYTAQSVHLPYRLRLGVTGHRSLPDPAAIAGAVDATLQRIGATLGNPATPLLTTVISPLAQGADRLVARAAAALLHAQLEVITPFPLDEYRRDFEPGSDAAEFEALLSTAGRVTELSGRHAADEPGNSGRHRDAAYYRVGERVVDACELLIAVWDGHRAAGIGGTADVVAHAIRRDRVVIWIDAEHPELPPRVILGISAGVSPGEEMRIESGPFPETAKALSLGYHQQAAYAADRCVSADDTAGAAQDVTSRLQQEAAAAGLPDDAVRGVVAAIIPEFVRADRLAMRYQRRHVWAVNGILRLAAGAVTLALVQLIFLPGQTLLSIFEVAAMVAVFALWQGSRRGAWHEKWLHDRYIAELLRAAMFTALAGGGARAGDGAPPSFYRGPRDWLISVRDTLADRAIAATPALPLTSVRRLLVDGWLRDQQAFHARTGTRKAHQAHRRHQLGLFLFAGTLLMATLHLFHVGGGQTTAPPWAQLGAWISFLALAFPVWAGVTHAITSQLELERVSERSARMAAALEGLADRAEHAITHADLAEIAAEAASLMLRETQEWWILLSFQDTRLHV